MKELICIMCPNGCALQVEWDGKTIGEVSGALCPRGKEYAVQELTAPKRNIATSVPVIGGELPLVSVRLTAPIPKEAIFPAMEEIRKLKLTAPVAIGTVVLKNILGYESDVIVTKNCKKA